jgi:hypothetical protein
MEGGLKMTNEMLRPCTLWDETFDACDFNMDYFEVFRNEGDCNYRVYFLNTKIATVDEYVDSFPIYRKIITTIAQALNPPIWVMDAVLEAVKKEPNAHYLILDKLDSPYYERSMDVDDIKRGDYIQADCPLALQVLLGFTTEGELRC